MVAHIPNWAKSFLSDSEVKAVTDAVKKAEATTTGEIVTVIVKKSSDTYWVPLVLSLVLFCLFLLLGGFQQIDADLQLKISSGLAHFAAYLAMIPVFLIALLLSFVLSSIPLVQRMFVPRSVQSMEVERRAFFEFSTNQVSKTKEQTGILIFISLMERNTVILADHGIASQLPSETWNHIVEQMIESIKNKKTAAGLIAAIDNCGVLLSKHFPAREKNMNELPDHLIIKE